MADQETLPPRVPGSNEDSRAGSYRILAINPGSTSTRVALFENERLLADLDVEHPAESMAGARLWDQFELRLAAVLDLLTETGVGPGDLDAVVGRGGLLRPLSGGTYQVNQTMLDDARANLQGVHPSNLGCALAHEVAGRGSGRAYVVDPVSVDEACRLAAYSGLAQIRRTTLSHALSVHACVRRLADDLARPIAEVNAVVAHLGGGISVCPVAGGKILDANNAISEGPFSPQRAGGLPVQELLDLVLTGSYDREELEEMTVRGGGLFSYLGTSDARQVERRIADGDEEAESVYEAMAYQISKEIGAMATVLAGKVDAIVLTGGLARSAMLVDWIGDRVRFIAPVRVYSIQEMAALAAGALSVLRGESRALAY